MDAVQRRQDRTISPRQPRSTHLTAKDRDLVTQHQDLSVLHGIAASQQQPPADHAAEDQIRQAQRHEHRGCATPPPFDQLLSQKLTISRPSIDTLQKRHHYRPPYAALSHALVV